MYKQNNMFSRPQTIIVFAIFLVYYILFLIQSAIIIYDNKIKYNHKFTKFFILLFVYMVISAFLFSYVIDSVIEGNRSWFSWLLTTALVIVPYLAAFIYAISPSAGKKVTDMIAFITMMPFVSMQ